MDVAYTDANPPGLDLNRVATQEELLRLWWSKTPSTQPRWIVGEEIPRVANVQYDELPILPVKYQSSLDPTGREGGTGIGPVAGERAARKSVIKGI